MKDRLTALRARLSGSMLHYCLTGLLCLLSPSVLAVDPALQPPSIGAMGSVRSSTSNPSTFGPNVYSGDVVSVQILVPPQHGTAVVHGLEMLYTPAPGYIGEDVFLYTATGSNGVTSAPSSVSLEMFAPHLTVGQPPVQGQFNQAYTENLQVYGGSAPYRFAALQPGEVVPGLLVDASGHLTGVPTQAGSHSFQLKVVDAYGFEAMLDYVLQVLPATPTVTWEAGGLTRVYGEEDFELVAPQSNSPGEFIYTSSNPAVATITGRTVTITGEGSTQLMAVQAATGNYRATTSAVTLTVGPRPDPTADAGVMAGLQAQVDAAQRFAQVQSSNIQARLRQVRNGSNPSQYNVALAYAGQGGSPGMAVPLDRVGDGIVQTLPRLPAGWGVWAAGTATFGQAGRGQDALDFSTGGVSVGADRVFGERMLLGVAGSLGRLDADAGDDVSSTDASQRSLAVYGLWRAGGHVFLDALLATGTLDFEMVRRGGNAHDTFHGRRQGRQWFGALTVGYEYQGNGGMGLTGYARYDAQQAQLDAYGEQGPALYALAYGRQDVRHNALAMGIEGSQTLQGGQARWRPFWNLEYRKALENSSAAMVNYRQRPVASDYRLGLQGNSDDVFSLGGGLELQVDGGWMFSLLLGHEQGNKRLRSNSIGLRARYDLSH